MRAAGVRTFVAHASLVCFKRVFERQGRVGNSSTLVIAVTVVVVVGGSIGCRVMNEGDRTLWEKRPCQWLV